MGTLINTIYQDPMNALDQMVTISQISELFTKCLVIPVYNGEYLPKMTKPFRYCPDDENLDMDIKIRNLLDQLDLPKDECYWLVLPSHLIPTVLEQHERELLRAFQWTFDQPIGEGFSDDDYYDYIPDAILTQQYLCWGLAYMDRSQDYNQLIKPIDEALERYNNECEEEDADDEEKLIHTCYQLEPQEFFAHNTHFLK